MFRCQSSLSRRRDRDYAVARIAGRLPGLAGIDLWLTT